MEDHDFTLLNHKEEVTFLRGKDQSILDLTWVNWRALQTNLLAEWTINKDVSAGSNHIPCMWTILSSPNNHQLPSVGNFLFEEKYHSPWIDAFTNQLDLTTAGIFNNANLSERDLGIAVSIFMDSMDLALAQVVKRTWFHPQASPWFTDEVRTALEEVRGFRKLYKIEVTGSGTTSAATYCCYKSAVKSQARLVRKAKQDWALQFAGQIKPKDVWKLTSWYKGIHQHHSPPFAAQIERRLFPLQRTV